MVRTSLLFLVASILSFILVCLLVALGVDWIDLGHGLNPAIAFPAAFLVSGLSVYCLMEAWYEFSVFMTVEAAKPRLL